MLSMLFPGRYLSTVLYPYLCHGFASFLFRYGG